MIGPAFGFGPVEAEFWRLLFVMTRIGAAMLAAPIFGAAGVSAQARVAATGAVAVMVCAWLPPAVPPALFTLPGLIAVGGEVLVGLALGFVLQLSFAAPTIAAETIGGAMGLSIASTADPQTGARSPALGQYYGIVLTAIFLGLGGHLRWLGLVVESYRLLPPGHTWLGPDQLMLVVNLGSAMFIAAVSIALPVTLVLLLVQIAAGVIGRSAPALNLTALGLPAGVLAGFAALIAAAPLAADQLAQLSADAVSHAEAVLIR